MNVTMLIGDHILITNNYPILAIFILVLSLYGAFENLIRKRISLFGLDRLGFLIATLFNKKIAIQAKKNPKTYTRLGIMQLLIAIGVMIYCIKIR